MPCYRQKMSEDHAGGQGTAGLDNDRLDMIAASARTLHCWSPRAKGSSDSDLSDTPQSRAS